MSWVAGLFGWWSAILAASSAIAIAGFAGHFLKDAGEPPAVQAAPFLQGLSILRNAPLILCLVLITMASGGDVTLPARLVDAGIAPDRAGFLLGGLAMALIVPVSLLSGWLVSRAGIGICVLTCSVLKGAVLAALALSPAMAGIQMAVLSVLDFVLAGAFMVLTWQFYMQRCRGAVPVAAYAVLTSLDALIRFGSAVGAGLLVERAGYPVLFWLAALVAFGVGLAVVRMSGLWSCGSTLEREADLSFRGSVSHAAAKMNS